MNHEVEKAIDRLAANTEKLDKAVSKMATERVGILQQLRQFGGCNLCKHFFEQLPEGCKCETLCENCKLSCECAGCIDHQNWEWCGPWEVTK